ncbi:MAG: winged helix-turn-helix transcriptional regulator [Catonella sp.]|jgi:predicted transcriptional regulator|nr:winged helix-turn-helix transcriptional regulator [Catonella sp.]MDY6356361.1 winged helix-turn-helix transcriptional regulator [Catonella sp.]
MLYISKVQDGLPLYKALGSDIRVKIIDTLLAENGINMNDLAGKLGISNGALTSHIKKLEECGMVTVSNDAEGHGNHKNCSVHVDKILIELAAGGRSENIFHTSVKVGHYNECRALPTCGLASSDHIIGEVDDNRYFNHPDRFNADILWFTKGYVEYAVPNFIPFDKKIDSITFTMELSSEAPGINEQWPSDIYFYLNDVNIAMWTSPGDFGEVRGLFTPDWWFANWNQYGLLKMVEINHEGTFIDGLKVSDVKIDGFNLNSRSNIKLKIAVPDNAANIGGLTIFGRSFGNYNQDIDIDIGYR